MALLTTHLFIIVISSFLGIGLGALIVAIRTQQKQFQLLNQYQLLQQQSQQWQKENHSLQQEVTQQQSTLQRYQTDYYTLQSQFAATAEKLEQQVIARHDWQQECEKLNQELRLLQTINSQQEAEIRELTTRFEQARLAHDEKQQLLLNSEQRLTHQFEDLATRIFKQNQQCIDAQNQQSLTHLLMPLREQLDGFRRHVQESFGHEAKERHTLTHEIRQLQQLNTQLAQDALNLTNALRQQNKTQGNWGEVILSNVLEACGLREGHEYQTQVSYHNEQGERQQPDVIVYLPDNKQIIIDAKMSLVAYERYFNYMGDPTAQQQALQDHIASIRNHIKLLSGKRYHTLSAVTSLDYVLLFIPIEPALSLAIEHQPDLLQEALKQNILLTSPTTLLVALRTIHNLWRYEYQNQNAQAIAEKATKLYEKVRLFVDDMTVVGQSLTKAQQNYQQALNKLFNSRGNIISQLESFKTMGVVVNKPIDMRHKKQENIVENV